MCKQHYDYWRRLKGEHRDMNRKKVICCFLAGAMAANLGLTGIQSVRAEGLPDPVQGAESAAKSDEGNARSETDESGLDAESKVDQNHMQDEGVLVTASSEETDTLSADKVKDGKTGRQDRWACREYTYEGEWLKTVFPSVTKVKEIDFTLFERDVEPIPSNIRGFDLEYKDANGSTHTIHVDNTQVSGQKGYETELKYIFEDEVYMSEFTIQNFDIAIAIEGNAGYNNISISEIEVYSNEQASQPEEPTLESVTASIKGQTVEKDTDRLELPAVPEGYTIESNGADFEQIVGKAGEDGSLPVIHPLTDKTVKISFNVTEEATGETKNTGDLDFLVKGTYTQEEGKNVKPVIIPEIQEWYSDSSERLSVDRIDRVVYSDDSLETVADEFISDYEDFTGIRLEKMKGSVQADAFNFIKEATDSLLGEEGYIMDIQADRIIVRSESTTGNMYGMQTILQMYRQDPQSFAVGQMRDYPRFQTRGFMFDVARKPVSLEMMQEVTRTMRYYKMNDFHVHLNDNYIWFEDYGILENEDEGFKAYEAFRLESGLTNDKGETPTAKDYSISKEDFKQFIQGERELGMNIVPEIDVPAHSASFTKVWPELKLSGQVNNGHSLIDHFDLTNPKALAKIKEIFDDYTGDGTFDPETTIHIGADEFQYDAKSYRDFVNEIVPYVKQTNTIRMWGGLTWIKDDPLTEIEKEAIENVEINLWSKDWADGIEMYEMGYKLINTIDDFGYMVPNGSLTRSNSYGDMLNVSRIFSDFEPNLVRTGSGYQYVPSGDDQMLGAAFAIWNDNCDKRTSGLTDSDLYWRFFDAMPFYAEKTWAATGEEKGSAEALSALAQQQGTGPNTNPYYQEDKIGDSYAEYDFEDGLKDASANERNLLEGENARTDGGVLTLNDGGSYVTTPIEQLGNGNQLSFDITLKEPAEPGDILFEEDAPYGTHDIRIMEDGKLGFTRELHNYYFDYELPVGKTVNITVKSDQQKTELYVDGEFVSSAKGKFIHNGLVKKENITNATFALPLERIGSKTDTVSAEMDNIVISSQEVTLEDAYNKAAWTGTANTETENLGGSDGQKEGEIEKAFDNDPGTHWHSEWKPEEDKVESADGTPGTIDEAVAEIRFDQGYEINQVSFTPRQDAQSGFVTEASLSVLTEDGQWTEVAKDQKFAADNSKKTFYFEPQMVYGFRFSATQSSDGWVTVSEFGLGNAPEIQKTYTVYVEAEEGGTVSGGKEAVPGESVTVTAVPDNGYEFVNWTDAEGNIVSEANPYEFEVESDISLTANFEKIHEEEPGEDPDQKPGEEPGEDPDQKPGEEPGTDVGKDPSGPAQDPSDHDATQGNKAAETGDASFPIGWVALSAAAGVVLLLGKKRRRPE